MRIHFSGYCFDLAARQLRRGETDVRLSPKAFELLRLLIENRKRAVSKAELHEQLWRDTFVTDANLSVLVAEIRHALRDRPGAAAFIRTVRGFGYAFSANVSDEVQDSLPPPQYWLIFRGREIALHEGDNIIGREQGATVRLDLPSVSRRHARILISSDHAVVEDLGSKNGTFLRQERITAPSRLVDRDELQIGSARLVVRILKGEVDTETLVP